MSAAEAFNQDSRFQEAVDALVERHGLEGAENRLLAALSEVRQRKVREARS